MRATCLAHLIRLDLTCLMISEDELDPYRNTKNIKWTSLNRFVQELVSSLGFSAAGRLYDFDIIFAG
jgi:hypothetical protein